MPPIDRLLSQYSNPVRSWPGEEDLDAEARANYAAANPPKLQTEGGSIDKGDLLPIVRYPEAKKSPSEWQSSSDVMRQLDDGWRIEPFSRLMAPFKSMAEAWRNQPVLGPMVRPSQMNPEAFNQMSSDAMTVAGTGMTGGIGRAAVGSPVPHGVTELGIFGGRKAKTADLDALARAEEMVRIGRPREEVWSETGWFQGPDKQWRFEIDDSGNVMTGEGANYHPGRLRSEILDQGASREGIAASGYQGRLDRVLDHKDAFAAYPDLAGTTWASVPGEKMAVPNVGGVWKGDRFGMEINADYSPRLQTGKSITLHELQHGIQDAENFARGSNVGMFELSPEQIAGGHRQLAEMGDAEIIRETAERYHLTPREAAAKVEQDFGRPLDPDSRAISIAEMHPVGRIQEMAGRLRQRLSDATDPKSAYNRTAGEAEARLVQKRIDMTDAERRARPPWLDYDVPEKDQIVRFGNESGAMSNKPLDNNPELEAFARGVEGENVAVGEAAKHAWQETRAPLSDMSSVFRSPTEAAQWMRDEIQALRADGNEGRAQFYEHMLSKPMDEPVIVSRSPDGSVVVWDGYHRIAAAMARGDQDIPAVVGEIKPSPTLMASIDPLTAAVSPARQVDPLGYYSPTLDAALRLSQKKGTPEQMLAQLKKAGAKDSEIEVSGLKKMFEGKKSVSQEEIVKALEEGKVGLEEKVYRGADEPNIAVQGNNLVDSVSGRSYVFDGENVTTPEGYAFFAASMDDAKALARSDAAEALRNASADGGAHGTTRYAHYSLDPENPTYREVVLHLPETKKQFASWKVTDPNTGRSATYTSEENARKYANPGDVIERQPDMTLDAGFRSGHFDEPNIVGHMMVSETRLPDSVVFGPGARERVGAQIARATGARSLDDITKAHVEQAIASGAVPQNEALYFAQKQGIRGLPAAESPRVLTLDQVQSDWGQKLRDGGVRDEAKIQDLKSKIAEIEQVTGPIRAEHERYGKELLNRIDPGSRASVDGGLFSATKDRSLPEEVRKEASAWLSRAYDLNNNDATRLLYAELRTAEAATPGHPLVNTTDQWLNTTLRRAIRMASEEGQDYIAIPSGNTVLGYNPGQEGGMLGFYGGTPQEMSYLVGTLRDAAKTSPDAKVIDALDPKSIDALAKAGILDKKKIEGISVSRVLKNAESRFQGIVPKNLYALLQKLDKATPPPQVIDTLDSPSGKTGLGEGFTLFKITPEAKKAAKESGQPLFRFGGRVN